MSGNGGISSEIFGSRVWMRRSITSWTVLTVEPRRKRPDGGAMAAGRARGDVQRLRQRVTQNYEAGGRGCAGEPSRVRPMLTTYRDARARRDRVVVGDVRLANGRGARLQGYGRRAGWSCAVHPSYMMSSYSREQTAPGLFALLFFVDPRICLAPAMGAFVHFDLRWNVRLGERLLQHVLLVGRSLIVVRGDGDEELCLRLRD